MYAKCCLSFFLSVGMHFNTYGYYFNYLFVEYCFGSIITGAVVLKVRS
jgi:hypothetical protein